MTTTATIHPSPIGPLTLVAEDGRLSQLLMEDPVHGRELPPGATWDDEGFTEVRAQLDSYFAGERRAFDLPLAPVGTAFQREVWTALRAIPFGTTVSYAALAARVGRPKASRAVGTANGHNPLAIIVPCHRVIASDGGLGGYNYGLDRKRFLLALEGAHLRP